MLIFVAMILSFGLGVGATYWYCVGSIAHVEPTINGCRRDGDVMFCTSCPKPDCPMRVGQSEAAVV